MANGRRPRRATASVSFRSAISAPPACWNCSTASSPGADRSGRRISGNLLLIRGASEERQSLVDVVLSFDVDWMREPERLIAILANGTPRKWWRSSRRSSPRIRCFRQQRHARHPARTPERRLAHRQQPGESQARAGLGRPPRPRLTTDTNYYVYAVQNGNAVDLARILNATFLEKSGEETLIGQVDPGEEATQVSTPDQPPPDKRAIRGQPEPQPEKRTGRTAPSPPRRPPTPASKRR